MNSMSKLAILVGCLVIFGSAAAETVRGRGPTETRQFELGRVQQVMISGTGTLILIDSPDAGLAIKGQANVLDALKVGVSGDRLSIRPETGVKFRNVKNLEYHLSIDDLEKIKLAGGMTLVSDKFETNKLEIDLSGGHELNMTLTLNELELDASGSFTGNLAGRVKELKIDLSGSCDLDAIKLIAQDVTIDASGSAAVRLHAEQKLDVTMSGSSRLSYQGNPKIELKVSGSNRIQHLN